MKKILARSPLWHKSCRGWLLVRNVRNMASQAAAEEEMEASEASVKKTMRWQRWQAHETMVLIAAKKQQDLRGVESTEATGIESKKTKNKWKEIEAICREEGIERSALQCQARWSRITSAFTQIRSWEETRKPEQPSFWSLKLDERKTMGFLPSLDQKTYNALNELYNSKADTVENVLVKDDVEEVVELGSINHIPDGYDGKNFNANKADVNWSRVQGEAHELNKTKLRYQSDEMVQAECLNISKPIREENNERNVRDAEDNFFSEELEECKGGRQADRCEAMERTKILSPYLQMVVDDSNEAKLLHAKERTKILSTDLQMAVDDNNEAQLLHANAGKMDCNPTNLHTGQHEESFKVSAIAEHANPLILCDQKDLNDKAQLLPASAEMVDGSNKDSCKGSLVVVNGSNKAQMAHASAGKVDCNPKDLHTGQHEESLRVFGIPEHPNHTIWCDQKDANDKAQLLPASGETFDGSNKDSCKGSLKEHGAEENTIAMLWGNDNSQFSPVIHDGTMQAAKDKGIEKGADDSSSETYASVTDILVARGIAHANRVSASMEEPCECQKSNSYLSSTGVDVLNTDQSRQIAGTALSCISADKKDCKNLFEDRRSAEEACIDKNEKGEGFFELCEDTSLLCPKNAEDILTARADTMQSICIEAQNKNDASRAVECMMAQLNNVVSIVEEAYVTGVLKQVPEDNSTFPSSEIFESVCSAQGKGSEKSESQLSQDDHVEMIADMTERLEYSTGPSFEEQIGHLRDGYNEYNEKTTEPSQNIEHEAAVKDADSHVKREPCDLSQSVYAGDKSDTIERMKVAIKESEHLMEKIEIRGSTVDANPVALTCIQHQFEHAGSASEQKSAIKGDGGIFESARESQRAEVLELAAKELEFTIKDDRVSPVTSGKGSIEDYSQKMTTSSKADEDVFMYIPAATGNLVRSAVQTVRKFFKF